MQWLTHHLGGKVGPAERREYGSAVLNIEHAPTNPSYSRLSRVAAYLE